MPIDKGTWCGTTMRPGFARGSKLLHGQQLCLLIRFALLGRILYTYFYPWSGRRCGRTKAEFEAGYLRFQSVFGAAFAVLTYEMEVIHVSGCLGDPMACAVLPDVAFLASNTVSAVVLAHFLALNSCNVGT